MLKKISFITATVLFTLSAVLIATAKKDHNVEPDIHSD